MTFELSCYGARVKEVADLVGDFDLRSPMDVHAWYRIEWQAIAEALGFSQQLDAALATRRTAEDRLRSTQAAGIAAFGRWLAAQRPSLSDAQARAQGVVLGQLATIGRERGELWRVSVDPTTLAGGACYVGEDGLASELRVFYPDTAAGYFNDGWDGPPPRAESACGWQTPLTLYLGTFPWVYSTRLADPGPGLRWRSTSSQPALAAFESMAALLEPGDNLRQDARQVAALLLHFDRHTRPLVERLPLYAPGRAKAGQLYRRSGFLYVHQGSLHVAGLDGPRGRIAAPAYNYVLRRFACFFAVRRATLRTLITLPTPIQRLAESSPDPCLRRFVEEVARAG